MKGSIRQRSPGSWELTIEQGRDAFGKRRRKHLTVRGTKAHAQRELRKLLTTLDQGATLHTEKVLLRDWIRAWIRDVLSQRVRRSTIVGHRSHAENHIIPALGHIPVDKLTPMHIQSFHSALTASGYAPNTLHRIHAVLSGVLKYALRMSVIQRNPASLVTLPSRARSEVAIPDIAAVRRAIELARDEEHPYYSIVHLIAYTGIRRGEALALLWNNVDLDNGFILIEASLVPVGGDLIVEPPKTASGCRIVDIDQGTADVLAEHRELQHVIKDVMSPAYDDRGRVFANEFGDWIRPHTLTAAVKALGARVGFPGMTVHSLRHFHASVALQTGQNIVVVSKRLGHSNVSITSDIYAHALPGWQRQAADAFAEAMEKGG